MILRDAFHDWIEKGKKYALGVELLTLSNFAKKELLSRLSASVSQIEPPEWEVYMLEKTLGEAVNIHPNLTLDWPPASQQKNAGAINSTNNVRLEPEAVQNLKARVRRLHSEHRHAHAMLCAAKSDSERTEWAEKIMTELVPPIERIYAQLRGWEKTGELVENESPVGKAANDLLALVKRQKYLRERISRLKNQLIPNAPLNEKTAFEQEMYLKSAELLTVTEQLSNL